MIPKDFRPLKSVSLERLDEWARRFCYLRRVRLWLLVWELWSAVSLNRPCSRACLFYATGSMDESQGVELI